MTTRARVYAAILVAAVVLVLWIWGSARVADTLERRELQVADSVAQAWRAAYAPLRARAQTLAAPAAAAGARSDAVRPVAGRARAKADTALVVVTTVLQHDTTEAVKLALADLSAGLARWKQQAALDSMTVARYRMLFAADSLADAAADSLVRAERSRGDRYQAAYLRQRSPWRIGVGVLLTPRRSCADAQVAAVCGGAFLGYTRPISIPFLRLADRTD